MPEGSRERPSKRQMSWSEARSSQLRQTRSASPLDNRDAGGAEEGGWLLAGELEEVGLELLQSVGDALDGPFTRDNGQVRWLWLADGAAVT